MTTSYDYDINALIRIEDKLRAVIADAEAALKVVENTEAEDALTDLVGLLKDAMGDTTSGAIQELVLEDNKLLRRLGMEA